MTSSVTRWARSTTFHPTLPQHSPALRRHMLSPSSGTSPMAVYGARRNLLAAMMGVIMGEDAANDKATEYTRSPKQPPLKP